MKARARLASLLLPLGLAGLAVPLAAQERVCDLARSGRVDRQERAGGSILNLHDPFVVRCTDGTELRANRGTFNQGTRRLDLHGNVFFEDPIRTLTADDAVYQGDIGRLHATGNVVFVDRQEGSTIRGPELEYFRPIGDRLEPQVYARQRPHLTLAPRDSGEDAEPLEIDADAVDIVGRDELHARGSVVITRTDLRATSREARYDGATGGLELRGDATIRSGDYDLAGQVVQARMVENALEHVHARTDASLQGEDLMVTAPDLQLFFADDLLQRAVARVPRADSLGPRAVATSETFRLEADSIDALVPAQRVEQVVAIGRARGESIDTLVSREARVAALDVDTAVVAEPDPSPAVPAAPRGLIDHDWIRGDTIIGYFASAAPTEKGDTTAVLERIVARGSALSLYRVEKENTSPDARRGINFLSGNEIVLTFAAGELELAEVDGLGTGVFLDPRPQRVPAATASNTGGG
jgi:lipopolysaccharide export system protein LptA